MLKGILVSSLLLLGAFAQATSGQTLATSMFDQVKQSIMAEPASGPNFKVGDSASYNLNAGFIKGSMKMTVTKAEASEVVIHQDLDMGFLGKQSCDATIDMSTGSYKKLVCNGQDQQIPSQGDLELVDMKEDKITVPAGTFVCVYIKALDKKKNETIEQWANPKLIPVSGMIKSIAPSQLGPVTIELTSFIKN